MAPYILLPTTTIHQNGEGPVVHLPASPSLLLVSLGIEHVVEQQSLRLIVQGSSDEVIWEPLIEFPQRFYTGLSAMLLDLCRYPHIRYSRVQWMVDRWGRGDKIPSFRLYVAAGLLAPALSPIAG